jgi:hypothetical protein
LPGINTLGETEQIGTARLEIDGKNPEIVGKSSSIESARKDQPGLYLGRVGTALLGYFGTFSGGSS